MHPPEQNPSPHPQGGPQPPFDMFEPARKPPPSPSSEVTQQIPLRWPQPPAPPPSSPQQLPPPPTVQQPPMPRRQVPGEYTEPMAERRPPAPPGRRTRPAPPVPIVSEEPPLYRRTGPVIGLAVGAALLLGVGIGVAGYALSGSSHSSTTHVAAPTGTSTESADPVTAASVTETMPPLPPPPSSAPSTTTTTTKSTSTTTSASAAAQPSSAAVVTGRFSGTLATKNGSSWVVTGWDGTQTTVRITGTTKFDGSGFNPGETVNIFWHSSGGSMVADSVYGMG